MISFKGRHFFKNVILMGIRWYLAYSLSYRDIEELFLERGLSLDHSTINRWVVKYSPLLADEFRQKKKRVGHSWRMDESYIKVKGVWHYLYRAVDSSNNTIDSFFSKKRDKKAALHFFMKAINSSGIPVKINIDKSGSNYAAIVEMNKYLPKEDAIEIRQNKYLNNLIEQDHRFVKKITRPMLGFKSFSTASATLEGIELHHMIRKSQHVNSEDKTIFQQFYSLAG
jgi:putative transposase